MVSSAPTTGTTEAVSALERSRGKSSDSRSRLEAARKRLEGLDGELGRNAAQSSTDETALRSAMDEIKRLKKALKDGEKQRRKLLDARKRAADTAAKAEEKARKAEAKYDRAVLADMIQRTKEQDRQIASSKGPDNGSAATGTDTGTGTDTATATAATDGVEAESLGTATARRTAARTTARRASAPRTTTTRTPRPRSPRTTSGSSTSKAGSDTTGTEETPGGTETPASLDTTSTDTTSTDTTSTGSMPSV
jgi:chromosome segregation ATPase